MISADALACITGGIAEAFYGMPPKLQQETLKRLPEKMRAASMPVSPAASGAGRPATMP